MPIVDSRASFALFVYPFTFEPEDFGKRCQNLEAVRWKAAGHSNSPAVEIPYWKMASFPEQDLLPHVERYLNPHQAATPTAKIWKLDEVLLRQHDGLAADANWFLNLPEEKVDFQLQEVQLMLFCDGVGFLTLRAQPCRNAQSDWNAWQSFVYYFRFAEGQRRSHLEILKPAKGGKMEPFVPPLMNSTDDHATQGTLLGILSTLLESALSPEERAENSAAKERLENAKKAEKHAAILSAEADSNDMGRTAQKVRRERRAERREARQQRYWWHDVFVPGRLLSYTAFYLDDVTEAEKPDLLYRVRRGFAASQPSFPSDFDLRPDHPNTEPYARDQWFTFSLDGGSFVSFNTPKENGEFFRRTLPSHLSEQYFLLFLLALHQRFVLMRLSESVAQHWPMQKTPANYIQRETIFRQIRDGLLLFAARGYFVQVMQHENHHRCYRRWQQAFQIEDLYREVSDEVREIHNYLLLEKTERIEASQEKQRAIQENTEKSLNRLGFVLGLPALTLSFLGVNIKGVTTQNEGLTFLLCLTITILFVGIGFLLSHIIHSRNTYPPASGENDS